MKKILLTLSLLLVTFTGCVQKQRDKVTQSSIPDTTQSSSQRNNSNTRQKTIKNLYSCPDDNHPHMIDLGLPSGTKWACCNMDTEHPEKQSPTNYGGYYAWGETEVKDMYNDVSYQYATGVDKGGNGSYDDWHEETKCYGVWQNLGNDIAGTKYDVAHVKWGGPWVMPSDEQIEELLDNCTNEWTELKGVDGQEFTSKINGSSIFLPTAGYRKNGSLYVASEEGEYWSDGAYTFNFFRDVAGTSHSNRYFGHSVRPVSRPNKSNAQSYPEKRSVRPVSKSNRSNAQLCPDDNHPHKINLGLPSGTKWACCNLDTEHPEKQSPTNYGNHYAWGETKMKDVYTEVSYKYATGVDNDGNGMYDGPYYGNFQNLGSNIAGTQYDVAHYQWGGSWVLPSKEQIKELLDNCTFKWTTVNDVQGGMFTGPNGGCLFLPAAGYRWRRNHNLAGRAGNYWSSYSPLPSYTYYLSFNSGSADENFNGRALGYSVRPVYR